MGRIADSLFRLLSALVLTTSVCAEDTEPGSRSDETMVNVADVCPGVVVELRYAGPRNLTGACIYSPDARCYLRKSVAQRIRQANEWLREYHVRLKIWDAYRPPWAQQILWQAVQNREFVGDPNKGGSLHAWGAAVDVTLVDRYDHELLMPTDFDNFTTDASSRYRGNNPAVAHNLHLLQSAMMIAGFFAMHDEWWHFVAKDFLAFAAVDMSLNPADSGKTTQNQHR